MASGIYIIENTKTKRIYIGGTRNLQKRWHTHINELQKNFHHNRDLQHEWTHCGIQVFKFKVLEYCEPEKLIEREQHFLNIYLPKGICYNISTVATTTHTSERFSAAKATILPLFQEAA